MGPMMKNEGKKMILLNSKDVYTVLHNGEKIGQVGRIGDQYWVQHEGSDERFYMSSDKSRNDAIRSLMSDHLAIVQE